MRKVLVVILAILLVPAFAIAGTVTLNIEPSTDAAIIAYYVIEENGAVLTETCDKTHTQIILNNRTDGNYSYRVGAVRENSVGAVTAWSNEIQLTVQCSLPEMPDAPEIIDGSVSCP